jgi:hypothetical protein
MAGPGVLALLAGTLLVERLAELRLIVTPATICAGIATSSAAGGRGCPAVDVLVGLWGPERRPLAFAWPSPGLLYGSLVFVDEAAEDWAALDPLLGKVGGGFVGPERAAAMRLSVVAPT